MNNERLHINYLKRRWAQEEAVRDKLEERARRMFLEQEANQLFLPIENYLTRLSEVLSAVGGSVQVDVNWEHLGDQKLRRLAKVRFSELGQQLALDFTIEGASIFYCDKRYPFLGGMKALLAVLTSDLEPFFTSQPTQAVESGS